MAAYTIRRLLIGLVTLLLISFVVYALIRSMPGDPATFHLMSGGHPISEGQFEKLEEAFGLREHWLVGYAQWLGGVLRGDLGHSLSRGAPVTGIIFEKMGPTLLLSVVSLGLAYLLSVPMGVYSAHRSGRLDERTLSTVLYVLYSVPSYVAAILLVLLFGVKLGWLPASGMRSPDWQELSTWQRTLDVLQHMILPVTCYTYGSLAYYTRFVRSNMREVLEQDYIRTARAKGLSEAAVLWRHGFRNALIPFVTLVGLSLPVLLGGSVILEYIFAWPGMGQLYFEAVHQRDYPLIMGLTLMFSSLILLGTLLADLLYAWVDPRITYS